ncbi:MAG: methionyl-tRNA formyltransferase [Candidatus Pacebacteria bacterium]|nr:methionyl-tRNA formyltransferase [Candidatus Paceibacterota bacterium]
MTFIFFGTPKESAMVLDILKSHDFLPAMVVTAPDRPAGRGLKMTESPVAAWAAQNSINTFKPESLKNSEAVETIAKAIAESGAELAIVFAYGKIIPQSILSLFPKGTLNIHPSLLPLHRGPAPVEGAILSGDVETGVSIMVLDSDMDHGPIIAQEKITLESDSTTPELLEKLVRIGAEKIASLLPDYAAGIIEATEQDHSKATFTKKISKADGEIAEADLSDTSKAAELYTKYRAYAGWPSLYFFSQSPDGTKNRIAIKKARLENNAFIIERVTPEGKKEMDYADYLKTKKS